MTTTGTELTPPTLQQIVIGNTLLELRKLAKMLRIRGFSKLKKAELADAVSRELLNEWLLESILLIQEDRVFEMFLRAVLSSKPVKLTIVDDDLGSNQFFRMHFPVYDGSKRYVPEEVRDAAMPLIENGLAEKRNRCWFLHRYALAAVNLYGLIPVDELVDIFNQQNARKTDWEELIGVLSKFIANEMGYCFWNDCIIEEVFAANNFTDAIDLLQLIDEKPRYIPKAKEFLRYADWDYYERTSHTMKLFQFLQKELHAPTKYVADMVREMYHACVVECSLSFYTRFLDDFNIIMTEKQAHQFFAIIMEIHNNARLWSNKGYTPNELAILAKNK